MSMKTKSKKLAVYSLIIMGIGYIATAPFDDSIWIRLLQGGFEAGLVGGLADWFAVTALFRHPLGLPIPHTALLPNNRKRVTNGLVTVLKNDWLSKESIQDKIKDISFTDKLLPTITELITKGSLKAGLVKAVKKLVSNIEIEKMVPFIKTQIVLTLSNIEVKKILQMISSKLVNENFDDKVLDHVLKKADNWLRQEDTKEKLGSVSMNVINRIEADGMLKFALRSIESLLSEEKLGNIVQNLLLSGVRSLQHKGQPNREALVKYIRKEIEAMNDNEQLIEGIDKWKNQLLSEWDLDNTVLEALQKLQDNILLQLDDEEFIDTYLMPLCLHFLGMIQKNSVTFDKWIQTQISILIEKNHSKIGDLVQENLDKLDNETMIDMIENNIGKDLQWIRVNGAICGFIIGIILTGIHYLIGLI